MEDERKPTHWGLWIAVGLIATILYILSLPVYGYLAHEGFVPRWCTLPGRVLYYPSVIIYDLAPAPLYGLGQAYLRYWMPP